MSATEDARPTTRRNPIPFAPLALATFAGAALGVAVALVLAPESFPLFRARAPWTGPPPAAAEWAEPSRPGERAAIEAVPGGRELHVVAARAPRARRLAEGIAGRRASGTEALADARDRLLDRWQAGVAPVSLPAFAPAAECASYLLAEAERRRGIVRELPSPYLGGAAAGRVAPDADVTRAEADVAAALVAADPEACRRALVALAAAEDAGFARGVSENEMPAPVRGADWSLAQLERADSLGALASRALGEGQSFERELAAAGVPERLLVLARELPDPYAPLVAGAALPPVAVEPLPGAWAALVGAGGGLGALVSLAAALAALRLRRGGLRAAPALEPVRDPSSPHLWVHVVAGPSVPAVVRATLELAAHALARRERVLLVDAGSSRMHERLGRDARWGLMECLQGDMPVLGLVQYAGRPGFYLLARGHARRPAAWAALGRCLDDARLHFGRVIFVVDRSTPREFGEALAGRALEAWWAGPVGRLPQAAVDLSARLGIAFSGIDLADVPKATLEVLSARVKAIGAAMPAPLPAVVQALPEPEPLPVPEPPAQPIVLDCDLQVRQRLRFLAWMRRVQSESRRAVARSAPR